jgi:hypothetical protein
MTKQRQLLRDIALYLATHQGPAELMIRRWFSLDRDGWRA